MSVTAAVDLSADATLPDLQMCDAACSDGGSGPELLRFYNCKALSAATLAQQIDLSRLRGLSLAFCTGMVADDLAALAPHLTALEVPPPPHLISPFTGSFLLLHHYLMRRACS